MAIRAIRPTGGSWAAALAGTVLLLATIPAAQVPASEPPPLAAARTLYASARYDEALAVLDRAGEGVDRRAVEQYRSLCLLALGRDAEAAEAIAAVVRADPAYRPEEADASPRVRAAFSDVRRRLLPEIATWWYVEGRTAFDGGDLGRAHDRFGIVLSLLDDPDMNGRLGDLRVLAEGFLQLSARAAERASPDPLPAPGAHPGPAERTSPQPASPRSYTSDDERIVAPVPIRQEFPRVPAAVVRTARASGLLEVVIDEQGRVVSMTLRGSIHPVYDALLLSAAPEWRYEPATLDGQPVRFRKLIRVALAP